MTGIDFKRSAFLLALLSVNVSALAAGLQPYTSIGNRAALSSMNAVYSPLPEYPAKLANRLLEGEGVYRLEVNGKTGAVVDARVIKSAGAREFDEAALSALRRWRFNPQTKNPVLVPISFSTRNRANDQLREARKHAIFSPTPSYPTSARFEKLQSWGVYQMIVDYETGRVTDVKILHTTGSGNLDTPIVETFRSWLFYPRTVRSVTTRFGFMFDR
jgi:TonB family protein